MGSAAVARAIAEHRNPSEDWEAMCLRFVRTCLGVAARYPYAELAYRHTTKRHDTSEAPAGVPVWWSGGRYGHVALSAGGGYCWSNDILRRGAIDKVRIATITRNWGMDYKGWTEDINGVDVYPGRPTELAGRPRIHVNAIADAARRDPVAAQGIASHSRAVRIVERALAAEGLLDDRWIRDGAWGTKTTAAWKRWQRRLGDDTPSGQPGLRGLRELGAKHGFEVIAA